MWVPELSFIAIFICSFIRNSLFSIRKKFLDWNLIVEMAIQQIKTEKYLAEVKVGAKNPMSYKIRKHEDIEGFSSANIPDDDHVVRARRQEDVLSRRMP